MGFFLRRNSANEGRRVGEDEYLEANEGNTVACIVSSTVAGTTTGVVGKFSSGVTVGRLPPWGGRELEVGKIWCRSIGMEVSPRGDGVRRSRGSTCCYPCVTGSNTGSIAGILQPFIVA